MIEQLSISNWLTKNPLGIVALFISLIYGICSLLLGIGLDKFTPLNETILVSFIVIFPFVVLAAFLWLVIVYPNRLYGPSDFRTDETFLALQMVSPGSLGARLLEDAGNQRPSSRNLDLNPTLAPAGSKTAVKTDGNVQMSSAAGVEPIDVPPLVSEMYLMEGLAFQHLQNELGASILREVEIELTNSRKVQVDGLLQTPNATVAVEVFIVRGESTGTLDRARVLRDLFANAVREGSKAKKPYRLIEVFVLSGAVSASTRQAVEDFAYKATYPIEVRILTAKALAKNYGIPISA